MHALEKDKKEMDEQREKQRVAEEARKRSTAQTPLDLPPRAETEQSSAPPPSPNVPMSPAGSVHLADEPPLTPRDALVAEGEPTHTPVDTFVAQGEPPLTPRDTSLAKDDTPHTPKDLVPPRSPRVLSAGSQKDQVLIDSQGLATERETEPPHSARAAQQPPKQRTSASSSTGGSGGRGLSGRQRTSNRTPSPTVPDSSENTKESEAEDQMPSAPTP